MRILVTGGAGYVGTRLSNALYAAGHDVRVLDNLIYGDRGLRPGIELWRGDVTDPGAVRDAVAGIQAVFHLAAISNDPTGELDAGWTRRVNVGGTEILLRESARAGVSRFVFASSSSVLGIQAEEDVTEETRPAPITAYSKSKLEAEGLVCAANRSGLATVAVRPATICGPSPRQRFDLAVNALTGSAFFDQRIVVYGGEQRRPNLAISDMLRLYALLLEAPAERVAGQVFHAGWENLSLLQMAERVRALVPTRAGKPPALEVRRESRDPRDYHISSRKLERVLGFTPRFGIEAMVRELVQVLELGFLGHYRSAPYHNLEVLTQPGTGIGSAPVAAELPANLSSVSGIFR
jgi:nucleoside-diphosphate-sugar epimerase